MTDIAQPARRRTGPKTTSTEPLTVAVKAMIPPRVAAELDKRRAVVGPTVTRAETARWAMDWALFGDHPMPADWRGLNPDPDVVAGKWKRQKRKSAAVKALEKEIAELKARMEVG